MFYIFLSLFIIITDVYAYQLVKLFIKTKKLRQLYILCTIAVLGYLLFSILNFDRTNGQNIQSLFAMGVFLTLYIPKLWITIFLFLEDIFRVLYGVIKFNKYSALKNKVSDFLPHRTKFFGYLALIAATIHFSAFIHGIVIGRYNYRVIEQDIVLKNLPGSFNGFKILQISDLHLGSFDNEAKVREAINLINAQDFDLIVFTGDIVNNKATEATPWISVLSQIKTPKYGKYSILGNHDYGEYVTFENDDSKVSNFNAIKSIHDSIGFQLLLNEHVYLKNNTDSIALIGVENWGARFIQKGDIYKATKHVNSSDFKVVLSHDPSHFDKVLSIADMWYDLTLSGHTHGFQFGFELPNGFQWSPVEYVYRHWGGLYNENGRYIYVNRGFGYHGYPGRVGVWPEITVITLKKEK